MIFSLFVLFVALFGAIIKLKKRKSNSFSKEYLTALRQKPKSARYWIGCFVKQKIKDIKLSFTSSFI